MFTNEMEIIAIYFCTYKKTFNQSDKVQNNQMSLEIFSSGSKSSNSDIVDEESESTKWDFAPIDVVANLLLLLV